MKHKQLFQALLFIAIDVLMARSTCIRRLQLNIKRWIQKLSFPKV